MAVNENVIREQMCDIGRRVWQRGMVAANDGNFSVKISENEILCTPTGVSKGFMTPEMICKVDGEGISSSPMGFIGLLPKLRCICESINGVPMLRQWFMPIPCMPPPMPLWMFL